ncbi:MAG: hypothetical protein QM706_08780 [Nitrospira sp.]
MNHDKFFIRGIRLTRWAVRFKRIALERTMRLGWNADISRTIDACVHAEEALANLEAIETDSTFYTPANPPAQRFPARSFRNSRLTPHAWRLKGCRTRTRSYTPRQDASGFESVGSILPRVLRCIEAAAKQNRRGGQR